MDEMTSYLWNGVLTLAGAISLFFLKSHHATVQRLDILLNKTREEVAKEYVSKYDLAEDLSRLHDRFDRLENKIDSLMKG
jgi:hypothetical protein|tara:strand:- start:910 stop:1149 length:240 start_codon:yes stop_codon:yes gene_type:complete